MIVVFSKKHAIKARIKDSLKVKGCVVEFGVGAGRTALMIESVLQLPSDLRPFYLFDSFKGFPESVIKFGPRRISGSTTTTGD